MNTFKRKRTNIIICLFILILTIGSHKSSDAVTNIDFTSGTYLHGTNVNHVYMEDGFMFGVPIGNHFDSDPLNNGLFPGGKPFLIFHEGASNPVYNLVTFYYGGNPFNFNSFELLTDPDVLARNSAYNPAMTLIASDGRTMNTTSSYIGSISSGWNNITSVTFDIIGSGTGNVMMDNVNLAVAPWPISSTLFIIGEATLGFRRFRMKIKK